MDLYPAARDILAKLVAFDTTSRGSNLPLIEWVEAYLDGLGAPHRRVPNADGTKTNLLATLGPAVPGGVVLSGHTDVVPVDGQPWTTDPWELTEKANGNLYGRGTCDMKGFVAACLANITAFQRARLKVPMHFAFSYDEEIGCLGAPAPAFWALTTPIMVGSPTITACGRGTAPTSRSASAGAPRQPISSS